MHWLETFDHNASPVPFRIVVWITLSKRRQFQGDLTSIHDRLIPWRVIKLSPCNEGFDLRIQMKRSFMSELYCWFFTLKGPLRHGRRFQTSPLIIALTFLLALLGIGWACLQHIFKWVTQGLSLDIVRKQSVCVSRSLSIWLRMTLILTRGPIIIFATKNIQLGFVMSIPPHDSLLMQGLSVEVGIKI